MAPVLRAALVVCVMLAMTPAVRAQDLGRCNFEADNCLKIRQNALQTRNSLSDVCRASENYFQCVTRISGCGTLSQETAQVFIQRDREQMRQLGCGAEGTAVVSVVTLMLSLVAALVCRQ